MDTSLDNDQIFGANGMIVTRHGATVMAGRWTLDSIRQTLDGHEIVLDGHKTDASLENALNVGG